MRKQIFSNIAHPSIFEMAKKAGHKIKDAGYMNDRRHAVIFDGKKMASSDVFKFLKDKYEFYTFGNKLCDIG